MYILVNKILPVENETLQIPISKRNKIISNANQIKPQTNFINAN